MIGKSLATGLVAIVSAAMACTVNSQIERVPPPAAIQTQSTYFMFSRPDFIIHDSKSEYAVIDGPTIKQVLPKGASAYNGDFELMVEYFDSNTKIGEFAYSHQSGIEFTYPFEGAGEIDYVRLLFAYSRQMENDLPFRQNTLRMDLPEGADIIRITLDPQRQLNIEGPRVMNILLGSPSLY